MAELLNPQNMKLIGFADPREASWNVFDEAGQLKEEFTELPVAPLEMTLALEPDLIVLAAPDAPINYRLRDLAIRAGFNGEMIFLHELVAQFSLAGVALRRLAQRLNGLGVANAVAELGAYRGDSSWQLNVLFPARKLYLFDTFQGFDARDTAVEAELGCSEAEPGGYAKLDPAELLKRLPYAEQAEILRGWFPETALALEGETFALAYLDACLYQPTLRGLEFFFPRLSQGGVIVLKGYEDAQYAGVKRAVADFEAKYGALLLLPLGDVTGTVLIVHP